MSDRELMQMANRIEALAFEMKAPNSYTPQFVMLANEIRARARLAQPDTETEQLSALVQELDKKLAEYEAKPEPEPTRSQKLRDAGYTRRPKGWGKDGEEPEPYDKSEVNAFVQDLYDKKLREGRHGLYETLFHVVHAAIKHVHAPPVREWQGLTDEEVLTVMQSAKDFQGRIAMTWVNHENQTYVTDVGNRIARAIEAKLKEKNG